MRASGVRAASGIAHGRGRRGGFTLIESAMATIIIGVGVVAMIEAQQAFIMSNAWSNHAATGALLAEEIRELTRRLPKHDPVYGVWMEDDGLGGEDLVGWGPEAGELGVDDFDDIDDFDGMLFADTGSLGIDDFDLPGPIDAFGNVIPEIAIDGEIVLDGEGDMQPMLGWSQQVIVTKIGPYDTGSVLADDARTTDLAVGDFPLRVEVVVTYQGVWATAPEEVTRVAWIVP